MKKLIFILGTLVASIIFVIPNTKYFSINVASYKQDLPLNNQTEELETVEAQSLPSFLESSTGVEQTTNLLGASDPTVPLAMTASLSEQGIENDSEMYGIELDDDVKKKLLEKVSNSASKNSNLSETILNNEANSSSNSKTTDIVVLSSLAEFCSRS